MSLHRVILGIEGTAILISGYCVCQKLLLPYSYLFSAVIVGVSLAVSVVKTNERASSYVPLQVFLLFFFVRNVYYLSTQNVIPFGDAYWDYAVEKTYAGANHIFLIRSEVFPVEAGGYSELTWYSGWPVLHSLGLMFCRVTGVDPLYVNLIIPSLFGLTTIATVYLLVEKLRIKLRFDRRVTYLALLLYAAAPEAVFWQMQFTRQSFAIVLFTLLLYVASSLSSLKLDRRYDAILLVLALLIVPTHHFTSFTAAIFLVLFSAFVMLAKYSAKLKILDDLVRSSPKVSFLVLALAICTFMFVWWDSLGMLIWSTAESRISRLVEVWKTMQFQLWAPRASYPAVLKPVWVSLLLRLRDLLMYVPAVLGFLIVWQRRTKRPEKCFVIYSALAFGTIFVVDSVFFALEPFRVILLSMPLVAFLSSLFYNKIHDLSKVAWKMSIFFVVVVLVFSSFIGLWAHDFTPAHLYDPSISSIEVGEVTPYFIGLKTFFEERIAIENLQSIWADSRNELLYLLNPNQYHKIRQLAIENLQQIGATENELLCSFRNLNMYRYYGYVWGTTKTVEEAKAAQKEFGAYLNEGCNRICDDERDVLWLVP